MITLKELFAKLKKAMDADIETLTPTLMKRSADTNVFIAAEGRSCMQQMVLSCSEGKVLLSILPYASSKNASVKSEAAVCLGNLIMRLKSKLSSFKGNDKLIVSAATLLGDASQEVRNNARAAFRELFNAFNGKYANLCLVRISSLFSLFVGIREDALEELLGKSLPNSLYEKVKKIQ